jgi:ABC-type transport system involved in cytochrome bd biosynthesis fused ATPase/permease subunit
VASRTFLRITDARIRLVVVDEPSAAMDPTGEYELFRNLRAARAGRTMVFITHRFGHLTRHADVILWVPFESLSFRAGPFRALFPVFFPDVAQSWLTLAQMHEGGSVGGGWHA